MQFILEMERDVESSVHVAENSKHDTWIEQSEETLLAVLSIRIEKSQR